MDSVIKKTTTNILKTIRTSQKVLLHLHPTPDGDSLGSTLAMLFFLESIGKKVTLIQGDTPLPRNFSSLPGFNKIINKNYFEVNLKDYDLFIILDSSSPSQISKLRPVEFPQSLKTIIIDHHISNNCYADINYVDPSAPATCQLVYKILKAAKATITPEIATCLLIGLHTDTGGYRYPPTSSTTFLIASKLAKISPQYHKSLFSIENNDLPSRPKLVGLLLSNIKTYFNNSIAVASLSRKELLKNNLDIEAASSLDVANMLKSVTGWNIGVTLIEGSNNNVKVSFRTRDPDIFDVSKIALETGYGGGHKAAAGATIPYSLKKSEKIVLETIAKLHPQLGNP